MRNITLTSALVIMLGMPSLAAAGILDSLSGTADCNSWSADLAISTQPATMMSRLEYTVILQDANGAEVERFEFSDFLDMPAAGAGTFQFTGAWSNALDGNYTVSGDFTAFDIFGDGYNLTYGSFTAAVACGSAGGDDDPIAGDPCLYPYRYWANHPDQWPVTDLVVAGQKMDQAELMQMLQTHARRMLISTLSRELIAAQLNLANGGSTEIQGVVDEANALISGLSDGARRQSGQTRRLVMQLRAQLAKYNRGGCPEGVLAGVTFTLGEDNYEALDKAAVETMTLGTIKAMYR